MAATRQICIPVIQPPSASYCPPLLVTCVADLQQLEELWVVITTPKQRISQLYTSPFMIDDVGRVQLSAFVRRPGICDGPSSSAIFELSLSAPPLGKAFGASLIRGANDHLGRSGFGSATGSFVNNSLFNPADPSTYASVGAPQVVRNSSGPHTLATPTCQFTSARMGGAAPAPHLFQSLQPQDVAISVCDASGAPISLMEAPTSAVVVLDIPEHSAVLTCKANVEVVGTEAVKTLPQFQSLNDLLVTREGGKQSGREPEMSLGKTSSRMDTNGALGITAPEIGVLSTANGCGLMFRVKNVFKGAIGLDEPHNAEDIRRDLRKEIAHSFHFTGDTSISQTFEGLYKISDRTEPTRAIETRNFRVGDTFSLTMRPSGDVDYIHNDRIVFTSRAKNGIETLLAGVVRVFAEGSSPSIGDIALVPPRADQRFIIPALIYNGPSGEGIMRVWLSGKEFAPATAKVRLTSSSLPKWAFSTFSVASMFAVGALGCDGGKVAEAMVATESETLQLFQVDPDAATGQQYGRQKRENASIRGPMGGHERGGSNVETLIGGDSGSQISGSHFRSHVTDVSTRGPAGSGDDGSSRHIRPAAQQRQKLEPRHDDNFHQQQATHPYGPTFNKGREFDSSIRNQPSIRAGGEGRSGSLASLASNKRRALEAIFDE